MNTYEDDATVVQIDDVEVLNFEEVEPLVMTGTLEDKEPDDATAGMFVIVLQQDTRQRNIPEKCPYSLRAGLMSPRSTRKLGMRFRRGGVM